MTTTTSIKKLGWLSVIGIMIVVIVLTVVVIRSIDNRPTSTSIPTLTFTITASLNKTATATPTGMLATKTPSPVATKATTTPSVIITPTESQTPSMIVVTATGVTDLGTLLGTQPMTPVPDGLVDWDQLAVMDEWAEFGGLAAEQVLYAQSSVPGTIQLPLLSGQTSFVVPQGTTLIFGAVSAKVTLANDKAFSYGNGFYGAFTEGTAIKSMSISNGFLLIAKNADAQTEYCARVAQAINQKWAHAHIYRPVTWEEPVCTGVVMTPLDSDRPPVVSVTTATATP